MSVQRSSRQRDFTIHLCAYLFLAISSCVHISAQGQTNISTPAYELINDRAATDQESFYAYLDQDSGQNHGFPSGFMGTDLATITLNAGCIDSSTSSTGCSTDPSVLDRVHGTVMSVSFAAQPLGNWAGIALEEPRDGSLYSTATDTTLVGTPASTSISGRPIAPRCNLALAAARRPSRHRFLRCGLR
jgi:hypothetical protein